MTRRGWLLFAAMCVIWGIPYLLIRVAVRDVDPATLVFLRTGIGGLLLLPLALRVGGFRAVARRWRPLLAFSVIEVAGPWVMLGDAERHLSSSLSGLLVAAVPLLGLVVARLTGTGDGDAGVVRMIGLLVGLAGVVTLLGLDVGGIHGPALAEMGVVVLGYSIAPTIMARWLADLPSLPVVCTALLLVAVGYLPYAAWHLPTSLHAKPAWSVVVLAAVCTALAFLVFFSLVAEVGASRATVFTYVNPAVALVLGVLLLDEPFTAGIAVGFPLILVGSVLATRRGTGQSMRTSPAGVANTAAITPVSPPGGSHSTSTPSSG